MNIQVAQFSVLIDYTPNPGSANPPLQATVELNIVNDEKRDVKYVKPGKLVLRTAHGDLVYDDAADGGEVNAGPLPGLPSGAGKYYIFHPASAKAAPGLTEKDTVGGMLMLYMDDQEYTVDLPSTPVKIRR